MGVKGRWARLWVDTAELSARVMSATIDTQMSNEDVTAWQDTAKRTISTGADSTLELNGYLEALGDNSGGLDRAFFRRFGVDTLSSVPVRVAVMLAESASAEQGSPCYVFPQTYTDQITIASPATGVHTIDGRFVGGAGGMKRGLLLYRGVETETGIKTSYGMPASTTGLQAYLFVSAVPGITGTAQISLSHATTLAGSYTNMTTFDITATGAQVYTRSATNQYLRVNLVDLGGATSITFAVIACYNGVTQP